jgi:hypothetical protein
MLPLRQPIDTNLGTEPINVFVNAARRKANADKHENTEYRARQIFMLLQYSQSVLLVVNF